MERKRTFKMLCFNCKVGGKEQSDYSKGIVKIENRQIYTCPDCNHALFKKYDEELSEQLISEDYPVRWLK